MKRNQALLIGNSTKRLHLAQCPKCPNGGPRCGGKGNPEAPFVIIGESPGKEEIIKGVPLIGASGEAVHAELPEDMWNAEEPEKSGVYFINAMQCFPNKVKKTKAGFMQQACHACNSWVQRELKRAPRKVILCLGNSAAWTVTGNYGIKITQDRGTVWDTEYAEHTVIAVHPAAIMRGSGSYREYRQDFLYALELLEGLPRKSVDQAHVEVISHHTDVISPKYPTEESGKKQLTDLMDYLNHHQVGFDGVLASDVETTGFNCRTDEILMWGVCPTPEKAFVFLPQMIPWMRPLWEDKRFKWCWHNGKFDIGFCRRRGAQVNVDHDTMLMSYTMDEKSGVHDLETVAKDCFRAPDYKYMVKPYLKKKSDTYANVPTNILTEYLGIDLGLTKRIQQLYQRRIDNDPYNSLLYYKTLLPASELLHHIEQQGLYVNWDQHAINMETYAQEVDAYADRVREIAGRNINPNAPHDIAWMLFDKFKLRQVDKRSTGKAVLQVLKGHPAVDAVLEYRRVAKAYSTYVVNLPKYVEKDNRVHSNYLLHITPTGRLASRNPNLQNQPRRKDLRGQFRAAPGNRYTEVDLSQAELRSLAALSHDPRLVEIYLDNTRSLHKEVAVDKFGPNYTKDQYVRAKAVNFGIVYGRTAFTVAQEFKIPVSEAQEMIDSWFKLFPGAGAFISKCRKTPLFGQVLRTAFGRRKRVGIVSPGNLRALQNEAANFPHQSIASDITLHAAIRCRAQLDAMGVRIVNLVHDSILTEHADDPELSTEVAKVLSKELAQVPIDFGIDTVPFTADAETGYIWGSLEEFHV